MSNKNKFYPKVLTKQQQELLDFIHQFNDHYYLVGGTALALQIGHRRSIDFDLFNSQPINKQIIDQRLTKANFAVQKLHESQEELTMQLNQVKLTFYHFPFSVPHSVKLRTNRKEAFDINDQSQIETIISMPSILNLAAMKAYALGRRAKWKDYVDLYTIFTYFHSLKTVSDRTKHLFGNMYNPKLFREQLAYFKDINYQEKVDFLPSFWANPPKPGTQIAQAKDSIPTKDIIKNRLIKIATTNLS